MALTTTGDPPEAEIPINIIEVGCLRSKDGIT
jgi:hypothetical protein